MSLSRPFRPAILGIFWFATGCAARITDDTRVVDLIRDLGSDSIDRREAASLVLRSMDAAELARLRSAMEGARDPETRARIADAIDGIERRAAETAQGPVVGGLQATLRMPARTFDANEDIECRVTIRNVSDVPVSFLDRDVFHCEAPWGRCSEGSATYGLIVRRVDAPEDVLWCGTGVEDCTPDLTPRCLEPGESRTYVRNLNRFRRRILQVYADQAVARDIRWLPGEHEVRFVHEPPPVWDDTAPLPKLVSNPVRFTIK